jgi:hypothetical protein
VGEGNDRNEEDVEQDGAYPYGDSHSNISIASVDGKDTDISDNEPEGSGNTGAAMDTTKMVNLCA